MEDMDLSEDLEEILFLLEDNIFVRWRIDLNFFNQSIYGRLFERGNRGAFGDLRNMNLPEIKGGPNTTKLMVCITGAAMFHSGRDQFHNKNNFFVLSEIRVLSKGPWGHLSITRPALCPEHTQ